MTGVRVLLGAALLSAGAAGPAAASETDQYLAWAAPIEDSTEIVNGHINDEIERKLAQINRRQGDRLECGDLPPRLYRHLFHGLLSSRLRNFLEEDPRIDRHPDGDVSYFGYLGSSVFRRPGFPFLMPMARTIRVDGINIGIDKVNHIFGFGRRYYNRYRKAIRRGHGEEEALRRVVLWGARIERYFVGGLIDGIYSHADLEANYQGLRLALDLCQADPPHLVRAADGWRLARRIDLRDYVNPNFDESYNNSEYLGWRWRQVRPVLEADYCGRRKEPEVRARQAFYRRTDEPSAALRLLRERDRTRGRTRQREHSLAAVCEARIAQEAPARGRPARGRALARVSQRLPPPR